MQFNYKAKNSLKSSFTISYVFRSRYSHIYKALSLWITLLRLNPGLNFLNLKLDEVHVKLFYKYEVSNIFLSGSKEDQIKWYNEIFNKTKSLIKSNHLLYFSLLFKYMRSVFVIFYWYAELIKLDGNII